ncbi:hypothetical protein Poli38472_002085 [Pythium oligandrum]|uniref:EGF-like domain-containing protein n=1 Tax=Pythium oligandrum TaxID=41045 RepID=A0A8K1CGK6_PYTOL|nr:hypothetical protein Poli38472_002085 [Pythium oligandrum]|eukprot:TMW63144.1 hypothetical protein Poli38472_002085 [Pythium oligandrum]
MSPFASVLVLALLLLFLGRHAVDASTIGFHSSFTSSSSPFVVVECDATCASPGFVTMDLQIVRSGDLTTTDTVYVSTRASTGSDASATPDVDFVSLSNVAATFAPSETTKTLSVRIVSDGVYEEDERFEAVLSNPTAAVTLYDATKVAYVVIQDGGDAGIFAFNASTYTFLENLGTVQVKLVRTGGASGAVTVTYRLAKPAQSTAITNKNFMLLDTVYEVNFAENQREGFINFKIINDTVYEAKEFFFLEISNLSPMKASDPKASIAKYGTPTTAVIFIADDGDAGQFDFAVPFIFCREDSGTAIVSIVRSLGTSTTSYLPVNLAVTTVGTSGGSNATEGGSSAFDYLVKSDKLSWANGESQKTFAVKIFNNNRYESATRAFKIRLASVEGGASIGPKSEMWVYIVDDRDAGTLSFNVSRYDVMEDASAVTIEVVRTGILDSTGVNTYSSGAVSVEISTFTGTILPGRSRYDDNYDYDVVKGLRCTHVSPCDAVPGVAYTPLATTTLSFADGQTSKQVSIPILNNDLFEAPSRVFKVVLKNVKGGAHLGMDYEHPGEWFGYGSDLLALDKRRTELFDNVGAIVVIQDDGDPAVLVTKASLSVSEIGQVDSFGVRLNAPPTTDVTVALTTDLAILKLSTRTLTFTSSNWQDLQPVQVIAVPNQAVQGIYRSDISFTISSTDTRYNGPLRTSIGASGVVFSTAIYTQISGTYDTGNDAHAFQWKETDGVMTSPRSNTNVAVFVIDDDHADLQIEPESSRHQSGTTAPVDYVAVRLNGHKASVDISLSSKPAGAVDVTLVAGDGISVSPASLQFTDSNWNTKQQVEVAAAASAGLSSSNEVTFSTIKISTSSSADSFYHRPNIVAALLRVQRYPSAQVVMDSSLLGTRENDATQDPAAYSLQLGSEPIYWEPKGQYKPFETVIKAEADTMLTFSSDIPVENPPIGIASSIFAAGNSSTSTPQVQYSQLGAMRFRVYPTIPSTTGSQQVGSALLRLYRLSGGENGGLGGISIGVAIASPSTSEWDETKLYASCSASQHAPTTIECSVKDSSTSTLTFLPPGTTLATIASKSAGESLIQPTGAFDSSANSFVPAPGWVTIDVTTALNEFLAQQDLKVRSKADAVQTVTFLVYTRSKATFVYGDVNEVEIASKDHKTVAYRPELRVIASGQVNLAFGAAVTQSSGGSSKAAVDGKWTSKLGVSSSFAMPSTITKYPWWEADLGVTRLIEDIVVVLKQKASTAVLTTVQLPVVVWCFLSDVSLSAGNSGLAGFTAAKTNAMYSRQFKITTRSFTASEDDNIVLRWHVYGEKDGKFGEDRFVTDYATNIEARYLLIQVEGENSIGLNEVEIYQPALSATRISIGGILPSVSFARKEKNELKFVLQQTGDTPDCDLVTEVCRQELVFTSGDWYKPQKVQVNIVDDAVATGTRDALLVHGAQSLDPDFCGSSICDSNQVLSHEPCSPSLFSSSSVKVLRVSDDDENVILFSAPELIVLEGSGVFPNAPESRRLKTVTPTRLRCSTASLTVVDATASSSSVATCASAFAGKSTAWEVCIAKPDAKPMEQGSAWIMAGFPSDQKLTEIVVTVPKMTSAKYLRQLSVWWNSQLDITSTPDSSLLAISNGWTKLTTFTLNLQSSGTQTVKLTNLALQPARLVLFSFEKSYDDANQCLDAPSVAFTGYERVPFPLPIRGDLSNPDAVAPAESGRSRMHRFGTMAVLQVRLASEPVKDVVFSVVTNPNNAALTMFDPTNSANLPSSLKDLSGGVYESGETVTFRMPTALLFTAETWSTPQTLAYLAVDDNIFLSNRTISVRHSATSDDATAKALSQQTFVSGKITRDFGILDSSLRYSSAPFIVSSTHTSVWPHHWQPAWASETGEVKILVVDDDLPGVTLSQNEVIVSESASQASYWIALDSSPLQNVIVAISYTPDPTLFTVQPLQLTFTPVNWNKPQLVSIIPTPNTINDAGAPLTVGYDHLIAKANQPVLVHKVSSTDASYNGIAIGTNEPDRSTPYVTKHGVVVVVQDDDTGCLAEYTCSNGGVCVNITYSAIAQASVCRCPATFGMRDCSAQCVTARDCAFSRVEFRLQCAPGDANAICGDSFSPAKLVSTLYRMLTQNEFKSASDKSFAKLKLGLVSDVMYVVNSTDIACTDTSTPSCVHVVMDFTKTPGADGTNPIVDKLKGYLEVGSLQTQPLFVELLTSRDQYPSNFGATIAVWIFLGFCCFSVAGVTGLFTMRYVKLKKFHVQPQLDDSEDIATAGMTSPAGDVRSRKPPTFPVAT